MTLSVALPSFDAFLRSSRRSPAVLPRAAPSYYRTQSPPPTAYTHGGYESPTASLLPRSSSSVSPPSSPYYGHFVTLSPTSSTASETDDTAIDSWRLAASSGSDAENEYASYTKAATRYQDLLTQQCVAIAPRPRSAVRSSAVPSAKPLRIKKKYLKERQRCEIVHRVRGGEKQAHLAKEFGVSRAAVCYLLKHEGEILRRHAMRQQRHLH